MPPFFLSPSRIARYDFLECDRYLRFDATAREDRAAQGIPATQFDTSAITRAILASGEAWEEAVLQQYLPDAVLGDPPDDQDPEDGPPPLASRQLTVAQTLDALREAEVGTSIFQPTLRAPESFYAAYGLDPEVVRFTECRPDLIQVYDASDGPEVRVVDLKASEAMKLSHRIQVGVYTLLLRHVLDHEGIGLATSRQGGVWLFDQPEPDWFALSSIVPQIQTFLADDLMPILTDPADQVFWHLYYRCEWCDFYSHCREEAETTDNVSLVPYLSHFGKRHLAEVADVGTVDEFAALLDRPDAAELLRGSASLEGRQVPLARTVAALQDGEPRLTGTASVAMPVGEQVRVVLTLQEDPTTGATYGYAINRVFGKDLYGTGTDTRSAVAATQSPQDLADLRRGLVTDLVAILQPVHDHNAATDDWWQQKSLQAYVFDVYERELLVATLLQVIESDDDPRLAEQALSLLFHFQHPDLVRADDQPESEVVFPLVVLTGVLRSVMALPIPVAHRFADVNAALQPERFGFTYHANDTYDFALSNRVRADALLRAWSADDDAERRDRLGRIENVLRARAWGANSVINGLRDQLQDTGVLFAWPPKFRLPGSLGMHDPVLGRLAFVTMYEPLLNYLETRTRRAASEAERIAAGDTWLLTATDQDGVYVLDERQRDLGLDTNSFPNRFMTLDTEPGRRARLAFDDFTYRNAMYTPKKLAMALVKVTHVGDDGRVRITIDRPSQAFDLPTAGQLVRVEDRFTDFNSSKVQQELAALDAEGDSRFVRMVQDPVATRQPLALPGELRADVVELADRAGMTPSQLQALEGVLDHDLQLVWGPPGTGKTHFLALATLCMLEAARQHERTLRVGVTAFTHAAIDNCLRKLVELQDELAIVQDDLPVLKLTKHGGDVPTGVAEHDVKQADRDLAQHQQCVVGGTVWRMRDLDPKRFTFDLMVIDEGSQVKVAESALAIRRVRDGGRLLIAGDDKQLPPIVNGGYPEVEGEPLLHRSILECLRDRDPQDLLTLPLVENWRMNDRLCGYPAASIYPAEYGPATETVANRRLPPPGRGDELAGLLLDPDKPMVAVVFEDVRATAENPTEAALVADLAVTLRDGWDGDDEQFWDERLFVVSPHHVQIRAIRRALAARRTWDVPPFVDTVDKMQGQECDAVVVSYGVSDVEYALRESEFIYSLNRLNVAVTRARMKSIVLMSRRLLDPPIQALENDRVADGIAFMQGYTQWIAQYGEVQELSLDGVGRVTVMRA